jgi:actin related protein 2/3 complex, subunit 4
MVDSTKPFLNLIKETLNYTLSLRNFPSLVYEKINRPQVEVEESKELLMKPVVISRNENEKVEIEASINSVRLNLKIHRVDVEELLSAIYCRFLMHRTDKLNILRKIPKDGYDISFLITNFHLEYYKKEELIDFIIDFIATIDNEIINMRMIVNSQFRMASKYLLEKLKI